MKKFCNRIAKPQWRVSVPQIGATIFRRSPGKEAPDGGGGQRSSGMYDLEEAQKEFDRSHSVPPNADDTETSDSDDDDDERYEDARTSGRNSTTADQSHEIDADADDGELYADVDVKQVETTSRNLDANNGQFEYDVPKISFKFFEKKKKDDDANYEIVTPKAAAAVVLRSEVKIVLAQPNGAEEIAGDGDGKLPPLFAGIKSGSDPNLALRDDDDDDDDDDEDGDNFYKVPRQLQLKRNRLSQSMSDFSMDKVQIVIDRSTVEHAPPRHQVPIRMMMMKNDSSQDSHNSTQTSQNSENMDYCKVRSRLPLKIRRPTFLRKPRKAVDTWNTFRAKIGTLMAEQASNQRVGAYNDKEKVTMTINFEEMYKNSKSKCKQALRSTGKMFSRRQPPEDAAAAPNTTDSASSQIVKNDAFFDRMPIKASDIEYKLNTNSVSDNKDENLNSEAETCPNLNYSDSIDGDEKKDFDFSTLKSAFRKKVVPEGQHGFEDLRRYVKQGGDFCKELATILQERAEAETQYGKSLSKLSSKLSRACREGVGGLNEAWKQVAVELEVRAEVHRVTGAALLEETARPLRTLSENQHRSRKQCEAAVDKAAKLLADWRAAEAKGKKQSHTCARDNEKLQDAAVLDTSRTGKMTLSRSTSLIQLAHMNNKTNSDKETAKLEGKKRKAEDAVKKADIEYYTLCVRAERARLEWESAVLRGVNTFQTLEEERLNDLKTVLNAYLQHNTELGPRLIEATDQLRNPVLEAEPAKDLNTFVNLRQSSQQVSEQLLPDFYCEHITLAMNRERRKQALIKLLHLIRQDIERERKSKNGLENLSKAIKQTPNFGAEDSQQSVSEKLYHMKSMLTYLEGARYKVHNALAELDSRPKSGHPLAPHITITRDKSGLQQSILKVPQWLKEEWLDPERSPMSEKSLKSDKSDNSDPHNNDLPDTEWTDRGAADGNSNQPDSDFDEFSSQCSSSGNVCSSTEESPVQPIAQCKALYPYTPNLTDELALRPGDLLSVYRQQDDGWWLGECGGNVGIFPATYVEIIH